MGLVGGMVVEGLEPTWLTHNLNPRLGGWKTQQTHMRAESQRGEGTAV